MEGNFVTSDGRMLDIWATGSCIFGLVVVIANLKVMTFSYTNTVYSLFFLFASVLVYVILFLAFNSI